MADNSSHPVDRHRHAHRRPGDRRRRVLLVVVGAVLAVVAAVLVVASWDRSDDAAAGEAAAPASAAAPAPAAASTTPSSPPATTPAPTPEDATPTPDVPVQFADAMQQVGIPLDPHTGWVVAQGICVRLGQPSYDQFRLSEGVERLFPSVSDEQAHAFVAMVAESVCDP
jgi:pyruvate/2-oxoglutarate dehydrogenase complex dihydrolipoamide acyltransferase (E2) component